MNHVSETIAKLSGMVGSMISINELPKPTASSDEQHRAKQSIQKLTGWNDIQLKFRFRELESLAGDETLTLDNYVDTKGHEYQIEPHSGKVVQMGPESGRYSAPYQIGQESCRAVGELRSLAVQIIQQQVKNFTNIFSSLHPLEANDRRRVYFFRWENLTESLFESEIPPFVQVGLYADGTLASFADTLGAYQDWTVNQSHLIDLPTSWTKMKRTTSA
jgi:hypothetical protein